MSEPSIFTRIINGEIPAYKIYEDDKVIAVLDIHPIYEGHTLVIPKNQVDHIWDLSPEDYEYLWQVCNKIAAHIREVINPTRVGVVVEGFGVPHCHVHLIPIYHGNDLKKQQEDKDVKPDYGALTKTAERLKM
jgi:histidine triad (HIT) family protein